jgi:glycosyltransferase involved in cell wall biosynthesis
VPTALDATYSLGPNLSGIGVYSREILYGLARAYPGEEFLYCYRPHRFAHSYREPIPSNAFRRLLVGTPPGDVFHALNQRLDTRARRAVCTFHDLFVLTSEYSTPEFRARFADQARRAAQMSDVIIAVSRFTAGQVEELLGIPADRIRVVHHGVHTPGSIGGSAVIGGPAVINVAARENLVLFVGAIQKRKNVARLVKAFERLPNSWRLALAGSVEGYGAAEELRAVEESPRRADIDVLGYVSAGQLEALYARASIFAFPSLDEGFGMPVLDAMAHGVPVITSKCSAMPEVAGDAALLVDPADIQEIGNALLLLAGDDARRGDLARRGLERARGFTWESAVEQTWRVYTQIR